MSKPALGPLTLLCPYCSWRVRLVGNDVGVEHARRRAHVLAEHGMDALWDHAIRTAAEVPPLVNALSCECPNLRRAGLVGHSCVLCLQGERLSREIKQRCLLCPNPAQGGD